MSQQIKVIGMDRLQAKLRTLPKKVQTKGTRKAITAGTKPILAAERAAVPIDTGLLKKSLGKKISLKGGGGFGVVGPRRGFGVPTEKGKLKFKATRKGVKNVASFKEPTRYAHLAEKKKPFIEAAYQQTKDEAVRIVGNVLGDFIETEARL